MFPRASIFMTISLFIGLTLSLVQPQSSVQSGVTLSGTKLTLVGTIRNSNGSPATGQVIYFGRIENARVVTEFKLEEGTTTGLLNPNSLTDEKGNFRITLYTNNIDVSKEFTVGMLDCPKCFVPPRRRLMRNDLPLTFQIKQIEKVSDATQEINLGIIVLSTAAAQGQSNPRSVPAKGSQVTGVLLAEKDGAPVKQTPLILFNVLLPDYKKTDGTPLGMTLVLRCDKCPKATTDEAGRFAFDSVPPGQYTIGLGADYNAATLREGNTLQVKGVMLVFKVEGGVDGNLGTIIVTAERQ